jgi:hypothetical protein
MDPDFKTSQNNDKLEGKYANYFKVGHNAYEFVIDFGQYYPESEEAELYTRIITSPAYATALLKTLEESITGYEQTFGAIQKRNCAEKIQPDQKEIR